MKHFFIIFIFIISILVFFQCEKENSSPVCNITNPKNESIINFNENFTITVNASDEDGSISEVSCYLGQQLLGNKKTLPYTFDISGNIDPGEYMIRAIAIDNQGASTESSIKIIIAALVPLVQTLETISVGPDSITLKGIVISDGGSAVIQYGFCWSLSQDPTLNDNKVEIGSGKSEFQGTVRNLNPGQKYFVAAFATNSKGTSYGLVREIVTNTIRPTVATIRAKDLDSRTVVCQGEVLNNGGGVISEQGICYSLQINPTLADKKVSSGIGIGTFECNLTELSPFTKYYFKAYAVNEVGTSYGEALDFTTLKGSPEVGTVSVSNIGAHSAEMKGEIISNGGAPVTRNGFCYNKTGNPTIQYSVVDCNLGSYSLSATFNNLEPATQYYVSAFAENSEGISYGEAREFKTNAVVPNVETNGPFDVKIYSARAEGNITWNGGATVHSRGICWNTSGNPTINDPKTIDGAGDGNFSSTMKYLSPNTKYYFKAYAINSIGAGYGIEKSFTTNPLPDPVWMYYDDGSPELAIPNINFVHTVYYVRFQKPANWDACKITQVKLGYLMITSGQSFDILLFKNNQVIQGMNVPLGPFDYLKKQVTELTGQNGEWKTFKVSETIESKYFYVGMKLTPPQVTSVRVWADEISPSNYNNSGMYKADNDITIITDAKFYIQVYVEYTQGSTLKSTWLDADHISDGSLGKVSYKELLE